MLNHLKLAIKSSRSSVVASLWDPYKFKLANGNVYELHGSGHLKLANNSSFSSLVVSLWDPY